MMTDPAEPWEPLIRQLPEPWPDIARAQIRAESAELATYGPTMVPTDTQGTRHDDGTRSSITDPSDPAHGA